MKAKEIITEIERINGQDFRGGKEYLGDEIPADVTWKTLPGGSGLKWGIKKVYRDEITVYIIDPTPTAPSSKPFVKPTRQTWHSAQGYDRVLQKAKEKWDKERQGGQVELIGLLTLEKYYGPIKKAWAVKTITVDETRRGIGIAKALYGIVLAQLKATLVSGDSQTPGGRRNWLSLASIPGVEVKGLLKIDDSEFGPKKELPADPDPNDEYDYNAQQTYAQDMIEMLMQLGFQYVGKSRGQFGDVDHYFAFDVKAGNYYGGGELAPAIQNKLSQIYERYDTLLYASWTGQT